MQTLRGAALRQAQRDANSRTSTSSFVTLSPSKGDTSSPRAKTKNAGPGAGVSVFDL